ncbi:MAG: alpha/beta hydrolase, partial [Robiginitalea sp.]|nr:alpha/beta hydrolase [Robiginitalea sp.]
KQLQERPETVPSGVAKEQYVRGFVTQMSSPWMVSFLTLDPGTSLRQVRCPVLALNGEKDLQVPARLNLEAIKKHLEAGGNRQVTIQELPGLNHLFQESGTGAPSEYAGIEQTFAPHALERIAAWILEQAQ